MDDDNRRLTQAYRRVFNTDDGQIVLTDILNDLDFYSQRIDSDDERVRSNAAKNILSKCGPWRPDRLLRLTQVFLTRSFKTASEKHKFTKDLMKVQE